MSMNGRARQRSPSSAGGQGARPPSSSQHHSNQYRQHDRDSYDDYSYDDRNAYNDPRRRADLQRERSSGQGQSGRAGGERHDELEERDQPSPPPERGILVRALFDFKGADGAGICFQVGDVIEILGQLESGWWDGVFNNQRGSVHQDLLSSCTCTQLHEQTVLPAQLGLPHMLFSIGRQVARVNELDPERLELRQPTLRPFASGRAHIQPNQSPVLTRPTPSLLYLAPFSWLPSNYVVPLPEDEAAEEFARREAELFDDEWSEAGRTHDDGRSDSYDDHHRREEDERRYRQQQAQQQQPRQVGSNGYEQPRLGESPRGPPRDASEYWVPRVSARQIGETDRHVLTRSLLPLSFQVTATGQVRPGSRVKSSLGERVLITSASLL